MRIRLFAVLAALAVAASAQMNESITVSVVEVPVTVVDSNGNPIRGLTAANFKLYDQGKEVAITSVDTIDFASRQSTSAVSPLNPVARRKFMLLFDLNFSKPASLARAQDAARQFVAKNVQPGDLVGVGTIDPRGFRFVAAFTTDRQLVAEAIADPGALKTTDPLHLSHTAAEVGIVMRDTGKGGGAASEHQAAIIAGGTLANRETIKAEVAKEMDFLGDLATTLRGIPGRKQLVFLSEGFDPRIVAGSDAREDLTYHPTIYDSNDERRWGSSSAATTLRRMADAFRGSDVVLHAIDIQGLRVENDINGAFLNSNNALHLLAEPTGGMVFKNANKIESDFERLMKSQEVVYVLAFNAPAKKAGQFHELKVKLVNVPGGAQASARAGYYEASGETQQARLITNAEIVMNDVEQKGLRTASMAASFPTAVPVIVEVNGADLMKDVKDNKLVADMYVYAFDDAGTVRDRLYQQVNLDVSKVGQKLRANGLKYWATLSLPPGKYAVKTLVTAGPNKGFTRTDVVVPEANQLAASPIFVDENPNWVLVKGTSHDQTNTYPFDLSGEHFVPAATPRGRRVAIFVPNAKPDDVTFETNPKVKFLGKATGTGTTALVMEVDKPAAVTVQRRANPAERLTIRISPNL